MKTVSIDLFEVQRNRSQCAKKCSKKRAKLRKRRRVRLAYYEKAGCTKIVRRSRSKKSKKKEGPGSFQKLNPCQKSCRDKKRRGKNRRITKIVGVQRRKCFYFI